MSTIRITRSYEARKNPTKSNLDDFVDDIETFFNVTKLNDDNIVDAGLSTAKLVDESVSQLKFAGSAVTSAKLDTGVVTTDKIADSNVTTAKIADSNVTTAKVPDSAVTTAKIADGAVTRAKLSAANYTLGLSTGAATAVSSGAIWENVTNNNVAITTNGRPVLITLVPDGTSNASYIGRQNSASLSSMQFEAQLYRGATLLGRFTASVTDRSTATHTRLYSIPVSSIKFIDAPAAGTYTYTIKFSANTRIYYAKLLALEF